MRIRPAVLLGVAMLIAAPATAAEISVERLPDVSIISISGKLGVDDDDAFEAVARSVSGIAVVVLNSNGGSMSAGVNIGTLIRRHGFGTAVAGRAVCLGLWSYLAGGNTAVRERNREHRLSCRFHRDWR